MKAIRLLLFPFSILYGAAVRFRNLLFDWDVLHSKAVNIKTICIGNLTIGGTGKTPHVEYVVELLKHYGNVSTLSRGYKRKTKGFHFVSVNSTAQEVGDEPLQIKLKHPEVIVAVDSDRLHGVNAIVAENPSLDVVVLDDAFQHRYIKPGFSILLVDYNRPVWNDIFLPAGNLRDSFRERRRADVVVITKCPKNITGPEMETLRKYMKLKSEQKVFFSSYSYGKPLPAFCNGFEEKEFEKNTQIIAFSGIAKPLPFFSYIENRFQLNESLAFSDHHFFSQKEIQTIFEKFSKIASSNKVILTTEKDAMRIRSMKGLSNEIMEAIYYVPVEVEFLNNNQTEFNNKIIEYVRENKTNN